MLIFYLMIFFSDTGFLASLKEVSLKLPSDLTQMAYFELAKFPIVFFTVSDNMSGRCLACMAEKLAGERVVTCYCCNGCYHLEVCFYGHSNVHLYKYF